MDNETAFRRHFKPKKELKKMFTKIYFEARKISLLDHFLRVSHNFGTL